MLLLKGQTVTVIDRVLVVDDNGNPVPDEYGNDQYSTVTFDVDGCAISPGFSSEDFSGTESVTENVNVHMPNGTNISSLAAVIIAGLQFEVVGEPNTWESPFTGTLGPVEVKCKRVSSGGGVR
jgi:hypothetical protein